MPRTLCSRICRTTRCIPAKVLSYLHSDRTLVHAILLFVISMVDVYQQYVGGTQRPDARRESPAHIRLVCTLVDQNFTYIYHGADPTHVVAYGFLVRSTAGSDSTLRSERRSSIQRSISLAPSRAVITVSDGNNSWDTNISRDTHTDTLVYYSA